MAEAWLEKYMQDGMVDLRGNPILRSKRGGWRACSFIVGKDKSVVPWSIQDHISGLRDSSISESSLGASGSKQAGKIANEDSPKLDPRGVFHGHDSTVEDV